MFNTEDYTIICALFPRLVGFIYFLTFGALIFQVNGLIGVNGILPAKNFFDILKKSKGHDWTFFFRVPSIFWIDQSNRFLKGVTIIGTILSIVLMLGYSPSLMLLLLYILYISITYAGQDFLSFGWEGLLLETTVQAFLISLTVVPNMMVWISTNLLLFRFYVQAGVIKLVTQDKSWRDMTAVACHYQTQPLPNTIAWYIHKLPLWFHKLSCQLMFGIEIIVPLGIFLTEGIRLFAFGLMVILQFLIWFTGNFSYLNHLTVVLCTILLNNGALGYLFAAPEVIATPLWINLVLTIIGTILASFQIMRLWQFWRPNPWFEKILNWAAVYHIANRYGIFGSMTTQRLEVIFEGSEDGVVWKEYLFKYKPSELERRPRRIAPYQPRLDWQAWFLPFRRYKYENWVQSFITHLLRGTPDVLNLLRHNPFKDHPPKYVRVLMYEYTFTSRKERKETGHWWKRVLVGRYTPDFSLKE